VSDYLITPETRDQPAGTELLEELHRKGFPVEITLKGPDNAWESVRFVDHDAQDSEGTLSWDGKVYRVSIPPDASFSSRELQLYLVETLLQKVGGVADHGATRERLNLQQFSLKLKAHHAGDRKASEWVWVGFAWAIALGACFAFTQVAGPNRWTVLIVAVFASLAALGLTYLQLKHE
jgi:hypothetical protein